MLYFSYNKRKEIKLMTIYLDMDGTIADLYGAKDWLPRLRAYDAKVYSEARPLCNMNTLARKLNKIQRNGIKIGDFMGK